MLKIPTRATAQIHLIGAGGTGGYALEYLARLLAGSKHSIHVYDGDVVESKNLKRQNFYSSDIGRHKSTALVERLTTNIEDAPEMTAHTEYITSADDMVAEILIHSEPETSIMVLLAVDNIATRRLMNTVIIELRESGIPVVALDSGNDDQGGQVVLYANAPVIHKPVLGKSKLVMLPTMLQMFPEIDRIKDASDENPGLVMNCADNAESKPQSMMNNVRNGELLASITYQVMDKKIASGNLWLSNQLTGNTVCQWKGLMYDGQ